MDRSRHTLDVHSTLVAALLTTAFVAGLAGWQVALERSQYRTWDPLFVSACLTAVAGLWLARGQTARLDTMVARLADRGALVGVPADIRRAERDVHDRAERWAWRAGAAIAVGILVAFESVYAARGYSGLSYLIGIPTVGAAVGFLVGRELGRMLAHGLAPARLLDRGVDLRATAGHIDGAAGLKPLGDFYLHQAILVAIPAVFMLVWSLLFGLQRWNARYPGWRVWYLALLPVAIALEVGAFAVPLARVHRIISDQKREQLIRADRDLSRQIGDARRELESDLPNTRRTEVRDQLHQLVASYRDVETMPTWPVDRGVRRRLTLGNLVLIVPLVSQLAALAGR
jgi:hypothetical protein